VGQQVCHVDINSTDLEDIDGDGNALLATTLCLKETRQLWQPVVSASMD